jgi:adenylate kinase
MVNIIMTGMPGSGKGTQAKILAKKLGIPHISTGDIFRREMELKTPLGIAITDSMNAGLYTSDEITNEVVRKRLTEKDAINGFILDGYPRTLNQVEFLDSINVEISVVINLEIDEDTSMYRQLSRARTQNRGDGDIDVIKGRIETYKATVEPVLDEYYARDLVIDIVGDGQIEEITSLIYSEVIGL